MPRPSFTLRSFALLTPFALALALVGACRKDAPTPPSAGEGEAASAAAEAPPAETASSGSPDEDICFEGLAVSYAGALDAPSGVDRTQEAAEAKAAALHLRLERDGESFPRLARAESDLWQDRSGYVGTFPKDEWPSEFMLLKSELLPLQPTMVTPVVETSYGYVIARRCAIQSARFRQIVIAWKGAQGAPEGVERDEAAASQEAHALHAMLIGSPHEFEEIARAHSDDVATRAKGGDLGVLTAGRLPAPLDELGFGLPPLLVSPVIRTPAGYVIYQRLPDDYQRPAAEAPPKPEKAGPAEASPTAPSAG